MQYNFNQLINREETHLVKWDLRQERFNNLDQLKKAIRSS